MIMYYSVQLKKRRDTMGEMAKKIVKMDLDELLKVLNEAYSEEWLAY